MRGCDVEHDTSAHGTARQLVARKAPGDETIAGGKRYGFAFEVKSRVADTSRVEPSVSDGCQARATLGGPRHEFDGRLIVHFWRGVEPPKFHIRGESCPQCSRMRNDLTARNLVQLYALQVQRTAKPGLADLDLDPVTLHTSNSATTPQRLDFDAFAHAKRAADQRTRHHRAKTLGCENTVDTQTRRARARRAGHSGSDRLGDRTAQLCNASALQ